MPDAPANTNNRWFDGRGRLPRGGPVAVAVRVRYARAVADPALRLSLRDGGMLALLAVLVIDVGLLANDVAAVAIDASGTAWSLARLACLAVAVAVVSTVPGRATILVATVTALVFHTVAGVLLTQQRGEPELLLGVAVVITLGCAVAVPWGMSVQALLAAAQLAVLAAGMVAGLFAVSSPILVVYVAGTMSMSIYMSREIVVSRAAWASREDEVERARRNAESFHAHLGSVVRERTASLEASEAELAELCQAASHDLRPPLRTIAGFSEILKDGSTVRRRPGTAPLLGDVIDLARQMGERIDLLLRDVRRVHRQIHDELDSMYDVARAEHEVLSGRNPACRWILDEAALAAPSSIPLAGFLRVLLRYLSGAGPGRMEIGRLGSEHAGAFYVLAAGFAAPVEDRGRLTGAVAGSQAVAGISVPLGEVAAAARLLVEQHGGRAWIEKEGADDVLVCFHDRHGRTATDLA